MPNHKSAHKRMRQNATRRNRNRHVLATVRTHVKAVRLALENKDAEAATAALPGALRALTRAGGKGVMHRSQASRKIGRLQAQVAALS
jgi:small subunit ribosomal protein S20